MWTSTAAAVGVTLAVALLAGPLWDMSTEAASGLLDPAVYVGEVRR